VGEWGEGSQEVSSIDCLKYVKNLD